MIFVCRPLQLHIFLNLPLQDNLNPGGKTVTAEFDKVKKAVANDQEFSITVRELLTWFGAQRRGALVVENIEAALEEADLCTDPNFTTVWIDAPVIFRNRDAAAAAPAVKPTAAQEAQVDASQDANANDFAGWKHSVRMLKAANREVISVKPEHPIERAFTLMLAHDFSQLAVMKGAHDLKGAVSWKSIGCRLSQGNELKQVIDATEAAEEVSDTMSLSEVTRIIVQHDFVFVRSSSDNRITGVVTATDLSEQFQGFSEPFLLLERIELQIRRLIEGVFDIETLRAACHNTDPNHLSKITSASDLTFGEYITIFEQRTNWDKLDFVACRKVFRDELDKVRVLRNDIMHFHPDLIEGGDFEQLRRFSRLLDKLGQLASKRMGRTQPENPQ